MAFVVNVVERMANDAGAINDKSGADHTVFFVTIHLFCLPDPVLLADAAFAIRKQFRTDAFLVAKFRVFQTIFTVDAEQDAILSLEVFLMV